MVRREAVSSVLLPRTAAGVAGSFPAPSSPGRIDSLDSLRGVAALIVVAYHCTLTYFAGALPPWIKYSPLRLLVDGYGSVTQSPAHSIGMLSPAGYERRMSQAA